MTFAEAVFANQQCLLHELHTRHAAAANLELDGQEEELYRQLFGTDEERPSVAGGSALELSRECLGLLFDRDNTVLYGDPTWDVRVEPGDDPLNAAFYRTDVQPGAEAGQWVVTLTLLRDDAAWLPTGPDDKHTHPGRPAMALLPEVVPNARLVACSGCEPAQVALGPLFAMVAPPLPASPITLTIGSDPVQ